MKKTEKEALLKFREQIAAIELPDVKDKRNQELCRKLYYKLADITVEINRQFERLDA